MKKIIFLLVLSSFVYSCDSGIKNKDGKVSVEEGTNFEAPKNETLPQESELKLNPSLLGFWVGYFKKADSKDGSEKNIYVDDGFQWNRDNKINISINKITDSLVVGHSVVAGNARPFQGTIRQSSDGGFLFQVKEPGDDKYDGTFTFSIKDDQLKGTWVAYKDIDIKNRKYDLRKKEFKYNPEIMLEHKKRYINWHKKIETAEVEEEEGEIYEWISREFATATPLIYKTNASTAKLSKSMVENLKKGDLTIIRNTIYARHGYSFKNRPLRVFFDAQDWYIPVHTDIKSDFTDLEKENIELLLRYEKNASEYYDRFGRG